MADPFDTTGSDVAGTGVSDLGGMAQSPSFWNNLASFGANMAVGANARTPGGFLQYGNGFAGPLGAGVLGAQQSAAQNALTRANLAASGAQTQGQQLNNLLTGASIPYMLQQARMKGAIMQQQMGDQGPPQFSSRDPNPVGTEAAQPTSLTSQPFVIPPEKRQSIVQQAVAGTPVPPAVLDGIFQTESGWNANSLDPKSGAYGLGAVLPTTAANPGFGLAPVKVSDLANPLNAAKFTAQYLYARGKAMGLQDADWNDPGKVAPVIAAYHGPQTDANGVDGNAYVARVGQHIQAGPSWQVAQNGGTVASATTSNNGTTATMPAIPGVHTPQQNAELAQYYRNKAARERMTGFGGDPAADEAAARQFQDAADASGKPYDLRTGGMHVDPSTGNVTKNPDRIKVVGPSGEETGAYSSPPAPGEPGGGTVTPILGPDGKPVVEKAAPQATEFREERGKNFAEQAEKVDTSAESAIEDNFRWDQMRQESQSWNMGKFAPTFGEANAYLKATADLFNIRVPGLDARTGDFQAFNKNAGQLVRTAVHETSARASQQEYGMISSTLPTAATSPQAFAQIADQMQGLNDWKIARQKFMSQYTSGGNDPNNFNVALNTSLSPSVFLLHRMGMTPDGQQRIAQMFGKLQETALGRTMLNGLTNKIAFAQSHGYFDDQTQPAQQ